MVKKFGCSLYVAVFRRRRIGRLDFGLAFYGRVGDYDRLFLVGYLFYVQRELDDYEYRAVLFERKRQFGYGCGIVERLLLFGQYDQFIWTWLGCRGVGLDGGVYLAPLRMWSDGVDGYGLFNRKKMQG